MSSIKFLGAVNEVTGSKFIITSDRYKAMFDCGMYQGSKDEAYVKNRHFDGDTPHVNDVVLSHAHIDHSGMLPSLVKNGFTGKIYSTPPTRELCDHMLKDSVNVFTNELPVINKMLRKKNSSIPVTPLYSLEDVEACMERFKTVAYDKIFTLNKFMKFSFHDSCHILGSASVKIDVKDHDVSHRVWYTSDIGHDRSLLCNTPKIPQDIDYLVIESTYGNKKREEQDVTQLTLEHINDAMKRGGKVIIPAFSVGRMQNMILIIHKLHLMGLIPDVPIYIDSPLGVKVTRLYEKYEDQVNQETIKYFTDNGFEPFEGPMIKYIDSMEESTRVSTSTERCIIISASGMCEGGRIREHLKNNVSDKNSTVLFVGYNAIGTLGRRLQESGGLVTIDGASVRVRCKVETISGLSAHADLDFLVDYVEKCVSSNALKQIYLIHGDEDAIVNVRNVLYDRDIENVTIPELGKRYKL